MYSHRIYIWKFLGKIRRERFLGSWVLGFTRPLIGPDHPSNSVGDATPQRISGELAPILTPHLDVG
jgi:hypothetical protein